MTVVSLLVVKLLSLWNDPFYLWLYYVWHLIWSVIESPSFFILNCSHNIPFPSIYFQPICVSILKFILIESIYLGLFLSFLYDYLLFLIGAFSSLTFVVIFIVVRFRAHVLFEFCFSLLFSFPLFHLYYLFLDSLNFF